MHGLRFVPAVQFAERFQSDAIELSDVEEALVDLDDMDGVLAEVARGTLAFLLQVDDVAGCRGIASRQVVVLVELAQADTCVATDGCHVVAHLHDDEVVLVALVDNVAVEEVIAGCFGCRVLLRAVLASVELVQVVHLDESDESFGISWTGGIAGSFQSASPCAIVCLAQAVEALVSFALQEFRVVDVTVPRTLVFAESVVGTVVALDNVRPRPRASHLDAEVVVGLRCQSAPTRIAFQQTLCQRDARRDVVELHLFDGPVLVFVYVRPIGLIGALCQAEKGRKEE